MSAFRTPPRGLARVFVRLPVWLYRLRLGWLLGGRFLLLEHRGRRSGMTHQTVLEVVSHDDGGVYHVAAGWGKHAQWLKNIQAQPNVHITVARGRREAIAQTLSQREAEDVLRGYAEAHTIATRALGRLFGSTDPHELAAALPIVALRPKD